MPAAQIDLEQEILLPLLQPIISSVSVPELTSTVEELIAKEVRIKTQDKSAR
jgi:ABC-type maltose transport system permease subunit